MAQSIVRDKSFAFALRIVKMCQYLVSEKGERVLSKQVLRSGTSIGANVREAMRAQSDADFQSKMSIALKEADETEYWLDLLHGSGYLDKTLYESMFADCDELIKLLATITKTMNSKLPK